MRQGRRKGEMGEGGRRQHSSVAHPLVPPFPPPFFFLSQCARPVSGLAHSEREKKGGGKGGGEGQGYEERGEQEKKKEIGGRRAAPA